MVAATHSSRFAVSARSGSHSITSTFGNAKQCSVFRHQPLLSLPLVCLLLATAIVSTFPGTAAAPHRARHADTIADQIMNADDVPPGQQRENYAPAPPDAGILPDDAREESIRSEHHSERGDAVVGEGALAGILPDDDAFLKSLAKEDAAEEAADAKRAAEEQVLLGTLEQGQEEDPPYMCFLSDIITLRHEEDRAAARGDGEVEGDVELEKAMELLVASTEDGEKGSDPGAGGTAVWDKVALDIAASCEVVDLSNNELNDDAATELGRALKDIEELPGLKWLKLDHNLIGKRGAAALGDALTTSVASITRLSLGHNVIGNDGAKAVRRIISAKGSTITHLRLHANGIGPVGAQHLAVALKQNSMLIQLDLSENDLGSTGFVQLSNGLATNTNVKHLNLAYTLPADEGVVALAGVLFRVAAAGNSQLQVLELAGNNFGAEGCQALGSLLVHSPELQELNVNDNKFEDQGTETVLSLAKHLQQDRAKLTTFKAGGTSLSSKNVVTLARYLQSNTVLQRLHLNHNPVGDEGAKALAKMISKRGRARDCGLTKLDLRHAQIGAAGGEALLSALQSNKLLQDLQLEGNDDIAAEVQDAIGEILEANQRKAEADAGGQGNEKSKSKLSWAARPRRTEL